MDESTTEFRRALDALHDFYRGGLSGVELLEVTNKQGEVVFQGLTYGDADVCPCGDPADCGACG